MTFIVATNVISSRRPERRPTGTPHARAKNGKNDDIVQKGGRGLGQNDQEFMSSFFSEY